MSLAKLQNGSDVRGVALEGIVGEEVNLTPEIAKKISGAFYIWLKKKTGKNKLKVAVGMDSRLSGPAILKGVTEGIYLLGGKVYDCKMASTPAMFMATKDDVVDGDGGIMITASHLPFNRNGLKFFTKEGGADKKDITEILELAENLTFDDKETGEIVEFDFISRYAQGLVDLIREKTGMQKPFQGNKIVLDAGNGAGGFFAEKVLQPLGADTQGSVFLEPDGNFPNHEPNPENQKAMDAIQNAVITSGADLGIIFDTDVDRAAVVDGSGRSINRNALVALMSAIVLEDDPGTTIVTDSITSKGLTDFIESLGGKHHRFQRGYKNVINESIRLNNEGTDSHLAMETSGHCAFKENYFLDDGAYLVTKVLIKFAKLKEQGKTLVDLISDLKEPLEDLEFRLKIKEEDFKAYGNSVLDEFRSYVETVEGWTLVEPNYEGVRVNCSKEEGWVLIRLSLHDPVMAVNVESDIEGGCNVIKAKMEEFLKRFSKLTM
ncbi:phosphohexomutase domain-containing protein [Alkalibacter mobilis]|uniref:phosphomannomutase/phosphoglucomutase n=1 Tax=Alkalibacter mobilis TaxID=2787712 RepID=UPI00189E2DDC|nr:phosphomannomutase/phosphoglucomutase [Alkalibacter mobilis]MBF7096719.1 phosphomannomutase/phosphoglucomutase [Alkalibacter mobilis]